MKAALSLTVTTAAAASALACATRHTTEGRVPVYSSEAAVPCAFALTDTLEERVSFSGVRSAGEGYERATEALAIAAYQQGFDGIIYPRTDPRERPPLNSGITRLSARGTPAAAGTVTGYAIRFTGSGCR